MSLFTLEALNADEGDCLILHYGETNDPRIIVIDGGPRTVYEDQLKPRLEQLRTVYQKRGWLKNNAPLSIEMAMVSHIDNDHIVGLLKWTDDLLARRANGDPDEYDLNTLWHNGFDDIVGNDQYGLLAALAANLQSEPHGVVASSLDAVHTDSDPDLGLVLAGVPQGRSLRQNARKLKLNINLGFKRVIMAPKTGKKTIDWDDGLQLTVLCPTQEKLAALQKDWDKEIDRLRQEGKLTAGLETLIALAKYGNVTIPNRASIVVLAELGGKTMLLTGDSRGDDIVDGLTQAGLMKNGAIHVDLLKMQHHGSKNNFTEEFFQQVTAEHYVVSGDGGHGNPHPETLEMFSKVRGEANCTLWLTNRVVKPYKKLTDPQRLVKFFADEQAKNKKYKVVFRDATKPSLKVDVLDPLAH